MNKCDRCEDYDSVMRKLDEINDLIEVAKLEELEYDSKHQFKFEYAHESITEYNSMYKRRNAHA